MVWAIAGPKSRDLLQKLFPNSDVSNEGLPFMGYMEGDLFGVKARIYSCLLYTSPSPRDA